MVSGERRPSMKFTWPDSSAATRVVTSGIGRIIDAIMLGNALGVPVVGVLDEIDALMWARRSRRYKGPVPETSFFANSSSLLPAFSTAHFDNIQDVRKIVRKQRFRCLGR